MGSRVVVLVSGQVQGVGYRAFARRRALELNLAGTAENLPDGRVEAVAEGSHGDLVQFIRFLRQGPRGSKVDPLEPQWSQATGMKGFRIY